MHTFVQNMSRMHTFDYQREDVRNIADVTALVAELEHNLALRERRITDL